MKRVFQGKERKEQYKLKENTRNTEHNWRFVKVEASCTKEPGYNDQGSGFYTVRNRALLESQSRTVMDSPDF